MELTYVFCTLFIFSLFTDSDKFTVWCFIMAILAYLTSLFKHKKMAYLCFIYPAVFVTDSIIRYKWQQRY